LQEAGAREEAIIKKESLLLRAVASNGAVTASYFVGDSSPDREAYSMVALFWNKRCAQDVSTTLSLRST
jgi:hypothetical protein